MTSISAALDPCCGKSGRPGEVRETWGSHEERACCYLTRSTGVTRMHYRITSTSASWIGCGRTAGSWCPSCGPAHAGYGWWRDVDHWLSANNRRPPPSGIRPNRSIRNRSTKRRSAGGKVEGKTDGQPGSISRNNWPRSQRAFWASMPLPSSVMAALNV